MDREFSDFRAFPDDWSFGHESHLLGRRYLVGPYERRHERPPSTDDLKKRFTITSIKDVGKRPTGIYDLEDHELDLHSLPLDVVLRPDGQGNLYVWESKKENFFLLLGQDKRQLGLLYCPPPVREQYVGEQTFFRTKEGMLIYQRSPDSIITWTEEHGPREYGPRQGITRGHTWAMAEDSLGRVWMVRNSQLLVFDPQGDPRGE